jgi:hypothetical protein
MFAFFTMALALFVLSARADSVVNLAGLVPIGSCIPSGSNTCLGPSSVTVTIPGVTTMTMTAYQPYPGTFGQLGVTLDDNTTPNVPYVGVALGNNHDEIDIQAPGEMLVINFNPQVLVVTIDLNKFFPAFLRGDNFDEQAGVTALLNNVLIGTSIFTASTTNGQLTASLPFGGQYVSELRFFAVPTSGSQNADNSDFGVSAMILRPVPEPGTLVLLGSGLAAIAWRRRKS